MFSYVHSVGTNISIFWIIMSYRWEGKVPAMQRSVQTVPLIHPNQVILVLRPRLVKKWSSESINFIVPRHTLSLLLITSCRPIPIACLKGPTKDGITNPITWWLVRRVPSTEKKDSDCFERGSTRPCRQIKQWPLMIWPSVRVNRPLVWDLLMGYFHLFSYNHHASTTLPGVIEFIQKEGRKYS